MAEYLPENPVSLEYLNCSQCKFIDIGCTELIESFQKSNIKTLIFDGNRIGEIEIIPCITLLMRIKTLKNISFNNCSIGCIGIETFAERLKIINQCIQSVSFQKNRIKVVKLLV